MSLSTIYDVRTRYRAETAGALGNVRNLDREVSGLSRSLEGVKMGLMGLGKVAAFGLGAGILGGIGVMAKRAVTLTTELDNAEVSLASIFSLNGLNTFEGGMKRATSLVKRFADESKFTPGTGADIRAIIGTALPAAARGIAGVDQKQADNELVLLGKRALAAQGPLGIGNSTEVGSGLLQILSGAAGVDNALFRGLKSPLFKKLGIGGTGEKATQQFNKMTQDDPRKVFLGVLDTLSAFDDANAILMNKMGGLWGTLSEEVDGFLRTAGRPVMEFLQDKLRSTNKWIDNNREAFDRLADSIGGRITTGLSMMSDGLMFATRHADKLLVSMSALSALSLLGGGDMGAGMKTANEALSRGVSKVGGGILGGAQSGAAALEAALGMRRNGLKTMGGDVMRWQAYRSAGAGGKLSMLAGALPGAGASAARGAWGRMSMAGLRGSEAYMMGTGLQRGGMLARGAAGGLAGAARGAAGALGLGSLGTALMGLLRVAGPVGLAIGGVLAVMDVLKDDTNEVGNFFWDLVGKLRESLDSLASSFGFGEGSGGFMGMLGKMGTFIGETLTLALSTGVMAITLFVDGINLMVDVVRAAGATFGEMYMQYDRAGGGLAGFRAIDVSAAASAGWEYAKGQRRKDDAVAEAMREKRKREEDQKDANDDVANNGDKKPPVQVKVELHQTNVTDASPDRIAFKTMELLEDAFTNRRLSSSPMLGGG